MALVQIIEDEDVLARNLALALQSVGHDCRVARTGSQGLDESRRELPDVVLCDLRLPDQSGLDVLRELRVLSRQLPVILMTAYGSVRDAVEAMREGAVDYLQKPLDLDEVRVLVDRALVQERRNRELEYLRERGDASRHGVVGQDPRVLQMFERVERLRAAKLPPGRRPSILLTGETGTGKGLLARVLHGILGEGPFIEVNCTALPVSLVEAELFGHERGTFTDAKTARSGLFAAAEGGTLFLDEIGHLDLGVQAKFLKVIEEKRVRRLGSTADRSVDVHIIAATNRDLDEAVGQGTFREDLLHRLRVLTFEVPPLRERPRDVVLLARHFCALFGEQYGSGPREVPAELEEHLEAYPWPGNVRELRNVIERAVLLSPPGKLDVGLIIDALGPARKAPVPAGRFDLPAEGVSLVEVERELIAQALARTRGNRTRAAELLGLSVETLRYRVKKFDLE